MASVLKFAPLQSRIDASFWSELSERKLSEYLLSEEPVELYGSFGPSRYAAVGSQLCLDGGSFGGQGAGCHAGCHTVPGTLINLNTWDAFKASDKAELLKQAGARVWRDVARGRCLSDPSLLSRFVLLSHADLKAFHFHYWFALPAIKPPAPIESAAPPAPLASALGTEQAAAVAAACDAWLRQGGTSGEGASPQPAWLVVLSPSPPDAAPDATGGPSGSSGPSSSSGGGGGDGSGAACVPLSAWRDHLAALGGGGSGAEVLLAVSDPSSLDGHPGWPLRNLLLAVAMHMGAVRVRVLCVRESSSGRVDACRSMLLDVTLPPIPPGWCDQAEAPAGVVGWEADDRGRLLPRKVDLSPLMSPQLLADQAVTLNLRLMRWRAAPDLDIQRVADAKCLLLGAGTLGCAVSRTLLAWGCRSLTMLDSGRVAFSNPVRQWLYELDDCTGGGKPKATAACAALRRVWPSVDATPMELSIPMPGHAPANEAQEEAMRQAYKVLDAAVASHDVVFLLTDTRESRWLPSLLAASYGKVAVTAALGFDTFVVLRHGATPDGEPAGGAPGRPHRLGCYFCNDVVAPLNSTRNRTLDQQCTVARPGLAPIASALSVELVAALLQHPDGVAAPAPRTATNGQPGDEQSGIAGSGGSGDGDGVLGPVPHMIRGCLSGFGQTCMVGAASRQCTACSAAVVAAHKERGWAFVLDALRDPASLERVSGLAELHKGMDELLAGSDEEGGEGGGGGGDEDDWCDL
ncbi:hypothetical protein FOA52_000922 [Chlamydomonas sp. UWO 241]|nr:hypothetical protein FOA52_000922 [Chlamydomonas sp. UWO 241]